VHRTRRQDVSREPIKLGDDPLGFELAAGINCTRQLRAINLLAALNLDKFADSSEARAGLFYSPSLMMRPSASTQPRKAIPASCSSASPAAPSIKQFARLLHLALGAPEACEVHGSGSSQDLAC
jgi:hypothetical protein